MFSDLLMHQSTNPSSHLFTYSFIHPCHSTKYYICSKSYELWGHRKGLLILRGTRTSEEVVWSSAIKKIYFDWWRKKLDCIYIISILPLAKQDLRPLTKYMKHMYIKDRKKANTFVKIAKLKQSYF